MRETGYEQIERSETLPNLDLDLLGRWVVALQLHTALNADDPLDAALEFRQKIQTV